MTVCNKPKLPVFKLSLRSAGYTERGGPVRASVYDEDELELCTNWKHLLILVHGYNNTRSEAEEKYTQYINILSPKLKRSRVAPDAIAKLQWPGNDAIGPFEFFDVAGYPIDIKRAREAAKALADFLPRLIVTGSAVRLISFVGHSLGCRLIMETMCRLVDAVPFPKPPLAVVSLMAAAVPVAALATVGQPLAKAHSAARKVLKAYSPNDSVLWLGFPPGQHIAFIAGIEEADYDEAIGRYGNPSGFGEKLLRNGNGHSDYWTDEVTAGMLLVALDATQRKLPPPAAISPHTLPLVSKIAARDLNSRNLPQ